MNLYKNRQKYFGRLFPKDQHIYHEQADGADLFQISYSDRLVQKRLLERTAETGYNEMAYMF